MDYKKMMATIFRTPSSEAKKKPKKATSKEMKKKVASFKAGFTGKKKGI